jgi:hypothetical protein
MARTRGAGSQRGTSWTQASSLNSNADTPLNQVCIQVGRQVASLEGGGGVLSCPDLFHVSLCLSLPPLGVAHIPHYPLGTYTCVLCLSVASSSCLSSQPVADLTLSLPAVLYLCPTTLDYQHLPALTCHLPAPVAVINSVTSTVCIWVLPET